MLRITTVTLAVLALTAFAFGDEWYIETVDTVGDVGDYSSIALDSSDNAHISYYENGASDLKYARHDGTTWHIESVDTTGSVGLWTSIALDISDNPHISYTRGVGGLKYARYDGISWQIESVDTTEDAGRTSIALDSSDNPHISYLDYFNMDLKYARYDGITWHIESVDTAGDVGSGSSIALDTSNNPHISYSDFTNEDLKYAYYDGSSWQIKSIDTTWSVGWWTSIALDSYDKPHISYYDDSIGALKYARYDGAAWHVEFVDNTGPAVGLNNSIAVDSSDKPHISYINGWGDLKYARYDGTTWQIESLDPTVYVKRPSIALDTSDNPHISYYDGTNEDLKYAHGFENTPPSSFDLAQPPDGAEVPEPVTLDWENSTDDDGDTITYDIWYATDPSFDPHDEVTELTDSTYTFPEGVLTQGETYYWKVRAWDGYEGTWSGPDDYWSFTVENEPPGPFSLLEPGDGAVVTEPVTLDWEDSIDQGRTLTVGAGSSRTSPDTVRSESTRSITYDVWYAADPSFDPHDEVTELTDSTYTFPEGVLSDGTTYYWKVRAWDGFDATWSGPDAYWSFTVEDEVTDIPVTAFSGESARDGVELTWECADPGVGFNLYRSEEATGARTKLREMLNAELITGESPYSYLDAEVSDGIFYSYWLEAMDVGGASETFGPVSCTAGTFVPTAYALYQSRPNPARGTAVIAFDLPEGADVTLTIYDLSGRKVTTPVDETLPAGAHERSVAGLAPGVYVYRLIAGEFTAVRKMVVQ